MLNRVAGAFLEPEHEFRRNAVEQCILLTKHQSCSTALQTPLIKS